MSDKNLGKVKGQVEHDPGNCDDCSRGVQQRVKTTTGKKVCEVCMLDLPKADDQSGRGEEGEESERDFDAVPGGKDQDNEESDEPAVKDGEPIMFPDDEDSDEANGSDKAGQNGKVSDEDAERLDPSDHGPENKALPETAENDDDDESDDRPLMDRVVDYIEENPGCRIGEIVENTDQDYKNKDTARSVLKRRIKGDGRVGSVKISNNLNFYPEDHPKLGKEPEPQPETSLERLQDLAKDFPGSRFGTLVEKLDHHYSSKNSAVKGLEKLIRDDSYDYGLILTAEDKGVRKLYHESDYESEEDDRSDSEIFKDRVEEKVQGEGKIRASELVKQIDHHYQGDNSAQASMTRYIKRGDIENVERQKEGGVLWLVSEDELPEDRTDDVEQFRERVENLVEMEGRVDLDEAVSRIEHHYLEDKVARKQVIDSITSGKINVEKEDKRRGVTLVEPEVETDEDEIPEGADEKQEWDLSSPETEGNVGREIAEELQKVIREHYDHIPHEVRLVMVSWGDPLGDEDVLELLKSYNESGSIFEDVDVSVEPTGDDKS